MNLHILLVGKNHEHIFHTINHFEPDRIAFISSFELKESTLKLRTEVMRRNIQCEIFWVEPFIPNALDQIISQILNIGVKFKKEFPNARLNIGFTGGTNIMAIAAGICALLLKVDGHYILKTTKEIYIYNLNQLLTKYQNKFSIVQGDYFFETVEQFEINKKNKKRKFGG